MDLGIYEPNSKLGRKNATLFANTGMDATARQMQYELLMMDGSQHVNFNSIVSKYPHLSKEVIVGLVKAGANAGTPGIDKVASVDGISQVMRSATYVQKLPSMFNQDKSLFGKVRDTLYGGFKGTTRVGFAALRSPYDYVTTLGRDIYATAKGEEGAPQQFVKTLMGGVTGPSTTIGALARDIGDGGGVSTGSGFFISPESRVGKQQAKAMQSFGRVNGQSFTIGRGALATVGADPNSTVYKVASGVVDAVFNVALDPTTYLGPGALVKASIAQKGLMKLGVKPETVQKLGTIGSARGGKELAGSKAIAQAEKEAKAAQAALKDIKLTPEEKKIIDAARNEKGNITRGINNTYKRAEEQLIESERHLREAEILQSSSKSDSLLNAISPDVVKGVAALDDANLVKYVEDVIIGQKQDTFIDQFSQLSADTDNIGKAFPGAFFLEALPQADEIVPAAYGTDEFLAALGNKKDLNVVDLAKDWSQATKVERDLELTLRGRLSSDIQEYIYDPSNPKRTRDALGAINDSTFFDDLAFGDGAQTLAEFIAKVVDTKNPHAVGVLTKLVENIWKADAFSNIRAIHGKMGGTAVVAPGALAAKGIQMSKTLADSKDITSIVNVPKSLEDAQAALKAATNARDAALAMKQGSDDALKEIAALRDYASKDPDLIASIINSPEYAPYKKLMDLELEVGQNKVMKEFYRADAGLVDGIGGPLTDDLNKVNKFLLGKRFAVVAGIVAKETSASKIARLFNNKIDLAVAGDLAKAETADDVLLILRTHLASPTADPQLARSLSLKGVALGESISNPMIKTVFAPSGKTIQAIEKMEQAVSRVYIRSTILPLDDLDRLGTGLREWMLSARVPEAVVDQTIDKLISATATTTRNVNVVRTKIIDEAFKDAHKAMVARYAPDNPEFLKVIENELRLAGQTRSLVSSYANSLKANGTLPFVMLTNGKEQFLDGAVYAHQFLDDVVRLPDTKGIVKSVQKASANGSIIGKANALKVLETELGEHWRTAQLAFRVSYILRNVGEMQVRQYLSGHETLLNHPIGYLAMIAANPKGNAMQKLLTHFEKYGNDIFDNSFKDPEGATLMTQAMDEYLKFVGRSVSYGDPRSADAKVRVMGKIYKVIGSENAQFHKAFGTTLSRFNVDDMMQLVAKADTPELQQNLLKTLLDNKPVKINDQMRTDVLKEIFEGSLAKKGDREVSDFAKVFLKDPEAGFTRANLNEEQIGNWLFDSNSTASYQHALDNLMGTGTKGAYIRTLLADGVVTMPNGDIIRMPRYASSQSIEEGGKAEKAFQQLLEKNFPTEDMPNAAAIFADTKAWLSENNNMLQNGVDWFFKQASKFENLVNFGPEYRMSYWDHVGRYAPALSLDDLKKLQVSANKTLAPIRMLKGNKYIPVGKRNQTLQIINREIANRMKSPGFKASMSLDDAHVTASRVAGTYVKDLFYDATRTLDSTNKMRLFFPFLQAHMNTIATWGKLTAKNPVQVYKFGKSFDALTKPGSGAIYDITNTTYDEDKGFFYKDEFNVNRFRYPLLGNLMGAVAGKNMDAAQAVQLTAPVEALNLAMGAVNPMMPGVGPTMQAAFLASGQSGKFGPAYDFLRQWIFPFGVPEDKYKIVVPAWLDKTIMLGMNDQQAVERGVKGWAGFLATTDKYSDNAMGNDVERAALFNEAQSMSRWVSGFTAIFQSILPATPSQEVLSKIKTPEGKYQFMAQSMLYRAWRDISKENAGDYDESVADFAEKFGIENLSVILSGSTKSVTGTTDAWSFLNENPQTVARFATKDADIVPYFFPGGEAAMAYYNWQTATGRREKLSTEELSNAAENLMYNLEKSQITERQNIEGHSDIWYTKEMIALNNKYGGMPVETVTPGRAQARADNIGTAIQDPAFKKSPIYGEVTEFYAAYDHAKKILQNDRVTVTPDFGSGFWLNTKYREELTALGTRLMLQNPSFSHMYYSVFAPLLKKAQA
jgi:hypothetical protein